MQSELKFNFKPVNYHTNLISIKATEKVCRINADLSPASTWERVARKRRRRPTSPYLSIPTTTDAGVEDEVKSWKDEAKASKLHRHIIQIAK